jgi:hypothetical protein
LVFAGVYVAIQISRSLDPSVPTLLDGAWWPRSRDAVAELADLVIALDAAQAQVSLIMLNPGDWQSHPRRIEGVTGRFGWRGSATSTQPS